MDHSEARDLFSPSVDGEVDPATAAKLQAHLDGCESCREEYDAFTRTVRVLSSLKEVPPPDQFVVKVQQRIRRRSRGRFFSPMGLLTRLPYEWISFIIILIMLVMYYMMLQQPKEAQRTPGGGQTPPTEEHVKPKEAVSSPPSSHSESSEPAPPAGP